MHDSNHDDHKTAAELFAEWFEDNMKTDTVTADFFTTETEEEDN